MSCRLPSLTSSRHAHFPSETPLPKRAWPTMLRPVSNPTSSNGRTGDFGSSNRGSNPRVGTRQGHLHSGRSQAACWGVTTTTRAGLVTIAFNLAAIEAAASPILGRGGFQTRPLHRETKRVGHRPTPTTDDETRCRWLKLAPVVW